VFVYFESVLSIYHLRMFELNAVAVLFAQEILHALGEVVDLGTVSCKPTVIACNRFCRCNYTVCSDKC